MKTDVIFLGAGASVGAGFPDNRQLANYIIEGVQGLSNEGYSTDLREKLREANTLSIDAFCKMRNNADEAQLIKRFARAALATYPDVKRQTIWRSLENPYRDFIDTLFPKDAAIPDPRFAIVNFNYDGLLAKMLVDAVRARTTDIDDGHLAMIGGGYIHDKRSGKARLIDCTVDAARESFIHFMPHGTITALRAGEEFISQEHIIYSREPFRNSAVLWDESRYSVPAIDFPWERDSEASKQHRRQLDLAAQAVKEAKRIHFIGLAGHYLMRDSFRRIFHPVTGAKEELVSKQFFIATKENDFFRTFQGICDCLLPEAWLGDSSIRRGGLKVTNCGDFGNWIYERPHHTWLT